MSPMKMPDKLFMWTLNSGGNLASWIVDVIVRNVQVGLNLLITIFLGTMLYIVFLLMDLPQPLALIICLLVMSGLLILAAITESFVWLILPAKFYGRFLFSLIRLRIYVRGKTILALAAIIVWILELLASLLRPFSQAAAAPLVRLSSNLRNLGKTLGATELAKLQSS